MNEITHVWKPLPEWISVTELYSLCRIKTDGTTEHVNLCTKDYRAIPCETTDHPWCISAPAPSIISLKTDKPIHIRGMALLSFHNKYPVTCIIDNHTIGELTPDIIKTPAITLFPGQYSLKTFVNNNSLETNPYVIWAIQQAEDKEAVPVWFGTWAFYDNKTELDRATLPLQRTAAHYGIHLKVIGAGEKYVDFAKSKIIDTIKYINLVPESYKYILIIDGIDSCVNNTLQAIYPELEKTQQVILGAEREPYPDIAPDFRYRFPQIGEESYPCSGFVAGPRDLVIELFQYCAQLYEEIKTQGKYPEFFDPWAIEDDQFLWTCAYLLKPDTIKLDHKHTFVINLHHHRCTLKNTQTLTPAFDETGQAYWHHNEIRPFIIHSNGPFLEQVNFAYANFIRHRRKGVQT